MNKLVILFFLLVSFNLWATPKEIVFDKDKKIESIELRTGHLIDHIEVKSVIPNKSLREFSNLNEPGSRFVRGGDGSGGG